MVYIAVRKEIESQNVRDRIHWVKRRKNKADWAQEIWAALNGRTAKFFHGHKRKHVKITSLRSRLLDEGNLWGGGKDLVDALKTMGLIRDDSPKWIDLEMKQRLGGKGTVIEICDVGGTSND